MRGGARGRDAAQWVRQRLVARAANRAARWHPALLEARLVEAMARRLPGQLKALGARGAQAALSVADRPYRSVAIEMRADESFRVASIGKPYTAMLAMRLVTRGLLDLDEPVGGVMRDMPKGWRLDEVTPRQLLSHTAGFADRVGAWFAPGELAELPAVLRGDHGAAYAAEAVHPPGLVECYTSSGYSVLQLMLERRFGMPFAALARRELFDPLALSGSGFEPDAPGLLGEEYGADGNLLSPMWTPCLASSGLWTTALDMVRFGRSMLSSAAGLGGWLAPDLARAMMTPSVHGGGAGTFAQGFHVVQDPRVWCVSHGGDRPGIRAQLLVFPRLDVVFAAVVRSEAGRRVIRPLWDLMTWFAFPHGGRPA